MRLWHEGPKKMGVRLALKRSLQPDTPNPNATPGMYG